jgi:hypothetical protein
MFLELVEKIKQLYAFLALVECNFAATSFDLSKGANDVFALVINFLKVY